MGLLIDVVGMGGGGGGGEIEGGCKSAPEIRH